MGKAKKTEMTGAELASQQKGMLKFQDTGVRGEGLKLSPEDMKWWQDAKFGMFIHWGLYAIPARGEWHMHVDKVPAEQYAKYADEFVPKHYDAKKWVERPLARLAGGVHKTASLGGGCELERRCSAEALE